MVIYSSPAHLSPAKTRNVTLRSGLTAQRPFGAGDICLQGSGCSLKRLFSRAPTFLPTLARFAAESI